jgi:hypothetical protein
MEDAGSGQLQRVAAVVQLEAMYALIANTDIAFAPCDKIMSAVPNFVDAGACWSSMIFRMEETACSGRLLQSRRALPSSRRSTGSVS